MTEESTQIPPQTRNPYTLWFVVLSFVLPVALAFFMFFFVEVESFTNNGELLKPMIDVGSLELKDDDGNVIAKKTLTYKWRFISFVGAECDEACNKRLYETRQVHRALGKNGHRLLRMIVQLEPASEPFKDLIAKEYADALLMHGDEAVLQGVMDDKASLRENELYIMDPMGNIMMRFTQDQPSEEIKYDFRKLLKSSQIG